MKILEFAFICYPVTDIKRARSFYEGTLGLTRQAQPDDDEKIWFEYEIGPHTFSIGSHESFKPSNDGPTLALEMENFEEAISHLKSREVKFQMDPIETPVCRMAIIQDPDGNKLLIHKRKAL
jgi:predicted enzyme related to lactoylglutathione lyase